MGNRYGNWVRKFGMDIRVWKLRMLIGYANLYGNLVWKPGQTGSDSNAWYIVVAAHNPEE